MMDKGVEMLVERHRESAFQHGFAVGFGVAPPPPKRRNDA